MCFCSEDWEDWEKSNTTQADHVFSSNREENVKASPGTPVALTTSSADYVEPKEPQAAQRGPTGSLYGTKESELPSVQPE